MAGVSPVHAGYVRPIIFPVNGPHSFQDDFADPRDGGNREHLGIDIIAKKLTPVVSAVDGYVSYLVSPQASWGYAIYIKDGDGYDYRYLHLNNDTPGTDDGLGGETNAYAPGLSRGVTVTKGQFIGWVGDSGNAEATTAHLHFEMHDTQGVAFDPYESLLAATPPPAPAPMPGAPTPTIISIPADFTLIKYKNDATVYLLSNNTKYQIANEATFLALGFSWSSIRVVPDSTLYRTGMPIELGPNTIIQRQDGTPVTATPPASYIFTRNLSIGSSGEEVRQLQIKLKTLGYFQYYTTTGYFGPITRESVIKFQKNLGITASGIVDADTRTSLNGS